LISDQNPRSEVGEMNEGVLDISLLPHFPLLRHTFVNHATRKQPGRLAISNANLSFLDKPKSEII
jgi:hypothetical protein